MKIKNIQQYRTYYKNEIRDLPTRDENFIGTYYREKANSKKKFGWFDIYHGDKEGYGKTEDGIGNFLQSFLDMAKDGQAVYEFLQNAVDAGSSHFTMIWGEDEIDGNKYVLVANNGEMFDFNSVRSILNVGSSTKNSNSQNIGKFGIGFKLAHRLVGKDNGLDELINQNSGPILFSWKNRELQQLGNGEIIEPADIQIIEESEDKHVIQDSNPWLFKILITCFPCLPENDLIQERIKFIGGAEINEPTFKKKEYEVLARWVNKYSDILTPETYKEGSLFFIKLGKGKEADLADENLAEGVKFSMAILHETAEDKENKNTILKTVQLNRENKITLPELHYLFFNISKKDNLSDYLFVRFGIENEEELTQEQRNKVESEADIEVLFGFREYDKIDDFFKGAPNLYLYFPLSEEVHNFNFILHSNAFYKASSRTFLHKGTAGEDGINERLLRKISERTGNELKRLFESSDLKDNKDFLNLYAALLTSKESQNQDRLWIQEPFINELNKVLKKHIPIKDSNSDRGFSIESSSQSVYIKKTEIDIENWGLNNTKWFYWGKESDNSLWYSATAKLDVKSFDIFNLLGITGISDKVNTWINKDSARIKTIITELDTIIDRNQVTDAFINNLKKLKILEFNNGEFISLEELDSKQSDGYFIVHNKLSDIKDLLIKCDFKVSILNFNEYSFIRNYSSRLSNSSQLRSHEKLVEIFSDNISLDKASSLSKEEKMHIFKAFRDLNDQDKIVRIKQLKLFRNGFGELCYTKNLLKETSVSWLQDYVIHTNEIHPDLNTYLVAESKEFYEFIIYPNWERIAKRITQADNLSKKSILDRVVSLFEEYKSYTKSDLILLGKYNKWFTNGQYIESKNIYFNDILKPYNSDKYIELQKALLKFIDVQLPDQYFLDYCDSEVFGFSPSKIQFKFKEKIISTGEIKTLAEFSILGSYGIFNTNLINVKEDGTFEILNEEGKTMYYSSSTLINAYIQSYHKSSLHPLPSNLADIKDAIDNRGEKLYNQFIDQLLIDNETQVLGLINALLAKTEVHHILFSKIPDFEFDCSWENEELNKTYVGFLKSLLSNDNIEIQSINSKVVFNTNNQLVYLKEIDEANDSIKLTRDDKAITISRTNLLQLKSDTGIKAIQDFANRCVQSELITSKESDKLFKLTDSGITDELFAKFNETIEKHQLINVDQILFVVLSGKVEETQIKTYKILTQKDEWQSLEGNWLFPTEHAIEIFDANYILHNNYCGIQELLQLNDLETFIYGEKSNEGEYGMDSFFSDFLFQKACSSAIFVENGKPLSILKHLYQSWKKTRTDNRISKENEDWKTSLGFSPKLKVVGNLIVEDEYVGDEISSWIQDDLSIKTEFLKSIGFNIGNSNIIQLRNSIISQKQLAPEINIFNIETELLTNTLIGLADGFKTNSTVTHFLINDNTHQIIEEIVLHLIGKVNVDIPLPYYLSSNNLAILGEEVNESYYLDPEIHQLLIEGSNSASLDVLYSHVPIIYYSEDIEEYIVQNYSEFELDSIFVKSEEGQEHSEPFYNKWSENKNIKLIRCGSIDYNIIANHKESKIDLGIISQGNYYITSDEDSIVVYYQRNLSLELLSEEIENNESGNEDVSSELQELISERNRTLAAFYNALTSSGRDDFDNEIANSFMNTLKQKNIEDERETLLNTLSEEQKYSYNWFVTYLKYLLSFEQLAETTAQKSITFQKIKAFQIDNKVSDKYFLLEGANNLIPVNIEAFEDFSISLVFKTNSKEKIKVEGVSKKGQDLLVYCPKGIETRIKNNFNQVVNIKINFTPVLDLLQRLYSAFTNKDYITEWDDILDVTQSVNFLYGPPGTGKTTTISNRIIEVHAENPVLKCLVLTPTNKAGDVLAKKIVDNSNVVSVIRLGSATSPELEAIDDEIYQSDLNDLRLDGANVIISSIHRLPYYQVNKEDGGSFKLFSSEINWDFIIFDEASMINLPYQVFALMAFKESCPEAKIIIAGDPKQIPPVVDASDKEIENLDIEDENIYKMFGISDISTVEQDKRKIDIVDKLTTQYRSVQEIGQIFSEFSYQNLLKHHRQNGCSRKALPEQFLQSLKNPVSFIDIPIDIDNSVTNPRKLLYSSYHVHAGILASELIKYLDNCIQDDSQYNIGIISPYKAQALLVNKLITSMNLSPNLNVHCDTVHGFQGDECDIIVFIVNPNNLYYSGHRKSLLSKEYIYNVAISRAQDYLWIMNPYQSIGNNPHINSISSIHKGNGGSNKIITSNDIEEEIFKDESFIVKNSYITGHDSINVFGSVEMKYFIKASETAIDIQLFNQN